jgi:hypothetical protein
VAVHCALLTAGCAEIALMCTRLYTFAHRYLAPQGVRCGITGPLQADVQPLLLARRQQQHVVREADLGAQGDRSLHVEDSHSNVFALLPVTHPFVQRSQLRRLCTVASRRVDLLKHLDADGDGARGRGGLVLHRAGRLHHVADHQGAQPLGHLRSQVAQHLQSHTGAAVSQYKVGGS